MLTGLLQLHSGEAGSLAAAPRSALPPASAQSSHAALEHDGYATYPDRQAHVSGRRTSRSRRRSADLRQQYQHAYEQDAAAYYAAEASIPPLSPYVDQSEADYMQSRHDQPSTQDMYNCSSLQGDVGAIYSEQPQYYEQPLQDGYVDQQGVVWPSQQQPASYGGHAPAFEDDWDPGYDHGSATHPTDDHGGAPVQQPLEASADRLSTLAEIQHLCATQHLDDGEDHHPMHSHAGDALHEQPAPDPRSFAHAAHETSQYWDQQPVVQDAADLGLQQPNGVVSPAEASHRQHTRSSSEAAAAAMFTERPSARPLHHYTQSLPSSFENLSWPAHR